MMSFRAALLIALSATAAAPARAQEGAASDRILATFADCRRIAASDARLACFDKATAALEAAVAAQDVRIVDRADLRKARKSLFGLDLPDLGIFGGRPRDRTAQDEAFTQIDTTVQSSRPDPNGRAQITLADGGAVWQTTDPMNFPPRPGAAIHIRKGSLGGYFIKVDGRSYRGLRIR